MAVPATSDEDDHPGIGGRVAVAFMPCAFAVGLCLAVALVLVILW